jgi:hypothetical protein
MFMQISPASLAKPQIQGDILYADYVAKHNKHINNSKEYAERMALFLQDLAQVNAIN